jgi:hypothetical protein
MGLFITKAIHDFFVAFGVVIGGSLLAGIGALFTMQPPTHTMWVTAGNLKIWALVAAVGGTIDPLRVIESNFLDGHLSPAFRQIILILTAFLGAHMGTELMRWVCYGGVKP